MSLSGDVRADRADGERGTEGPLGGIQLFEPSVCNGMARLGGDRPMGKPSRAVSQSVWTCGLGLWMRVGGSSLVGSGSLAVWHVGGCKGDTRRVLSDKDPRYPVLVDRGGRRADKGSIAGPSGRNGERVSHKPAAPVARGSGDGCSQGWVVRTEKETRKRRRHGRWGHNGLYRTSPIGRRGRVGSGLEGPFRLFVKQHGITKAAMPVRPWMELLPEAGGLSCWKGQTEVGGNKDPRNASPLVSVDNVAMF